MENQNIVRVTVQGHSNSGKSELIALLSHYLSSINVDVVYQQNQGVIQYISKNNEDLIEHLRNSKVIITEQQT